jgi:hypothetical protein
MINRRIFRYHLQDVCSKLTTLRDSCAGISRTQIYPPSFTWFGGAAAICQEAMDRLKEVLCILGEPEEQVVTDRGDER